MNCSYIDVDYFIDSPFYCALPNCCVSSGFTVAQMVSGLIDVAKSSFDSYLGFCLCNNNYQQIMSGDGSYTIFTDYRPIIPSGNISINYIKKCNFLSSGSVTNYIVQDYNLGIIRNQYEFCRDNLYTISYEAGYLTIPKEIKDAMCMMVLHLAQRIDSMNVTNPDFSADMLRIDKTASTSFGVGKLIKQAVVRHIRDLNDLPIPITLVLQRYKINVVR